MGRFSSYRPTKDKLYFSSHMMHAKSYATRAPEFFWEALWAVYVMRHPEVGSEWNQSDEGHAWVLSQMRHDSPVVLHIEVSEELLGDEAARVRNTFEIFPPDCHNGGIEVGLMPSKHLQVVDQTTSDYWIDSSLLRFLVDCSNQEMKVQVEDGLWGQSFFYKSERFWLWRDIKALLQGERLNQLDLV